MNLRKISVIGLSACALLFSCNKDTKLSSDDAIKYAREHFKLTEAPTAKSGSLTWNLDKAGDDTAKQEIFNKEVKPNVTDSTYKASGSSNLNDTGLKTYAAVYCTEEVVTTYISAYRDSISFYTNKSGFKMVLDFTLEESGVKIVTKSTSQYDSEGKALSNSYENSQTVGETTTSYTFSYTLAY